MAMDKESLKKNQFWYLFGGGVVVILILTVCALFSGSSEAAAKRDALAKNKKAVADAKSPKNDKFILPWNEARGFYSGIKDKVWEEAFKKQQTFYVWPDKDGIAHGHNDSKGQQIDFNALMLYAADTKELDLLVREAYAKVYEFQFADSRTNFTLKDLVTPTIFGESDTEFPSIMAPTMAGGGDGGNGPPGRGPGAGGKRDFMPPPMSGGAGGAGAGTTFLTVIDHKTHSDMAAPTPEEIWILQEDFWVKREMLNIIRTVLHNAALFKPVEVKADEAKPEGVQKDAVVRRFTNGVWEFTLYVENAGGRSTLSSKSTLKNVSPDRAVRVVSEARGTKQLEFKLVQGDSSVTFQVGGEPLDYNHSMPLPSLAQLRVDNLDLSKDFGLEQKFDWSNAPIRRIDALRTAKQSHRTAICALTPNPIFKEKEDAGTGTTPGAGGQTTAPGAGGLKTAPGPGGPPPAAGPSGPGGLGGPGGRDAANSDTTPYGLERNRYIMATDYARHLPIAMDLVVEPAYIDDVLVAIANSPLRIQTTQVAFQKLARVPPPPEPGMEQPTGPMDGPRPKAPGFPEKTGRGPTAPPKLGPNGMPTQGADDANADTNLVELTIYGIATLYERPKPKGADTKQPGTPPNTPPGTPPGGPKTPPGPGNPMQPMPGKQ